jgi:hypothetical protein
MTTNVTLTVNDRIKVRLELITFTPDLQQRTTTIECDAVVQSLCPITGRYDDEINPGQIIPTIRLGNYGKVTVDQVTAGLVHNTATQEVRKV